MTRDEIQRRYRLKHKDSINEKQRELGKTPERKKYLKDYYQKDVEYHRERHRLWRTKNKEQCLLIDYRKMDKKKDMVCDLTIEWLKNNITSKSCIYCGETKNIGCDRVDNTKGHTIDNCVPCCLICNRTRMNFYSFQEMLMLAPVLRQIKLNRYEREIDNE